MDAKLELPDILAHGRALILMSPCPPHQVVEITAELIEGAVRRDNLQAVIKRRPALSADSSADLERLIVSVPGNPAIARLIKSGCIDGPDGLAGTGVPVLTIGPMVGHDGQAANAAKRHLILVGCGVPPFTPIAAVESTCPTVVWPAVGHDAFS